MVSPLKALLIVTSYTYVSAASSKIELDCKIINVSGKTFEDHYAEQLSDRLAGTGTYCVGEMSTELLPYTGVQTSTDTFQPFHKSAVKNEEEGTAIEIDSPEYNIANILFEKQLKEDLNAEDCKLTTFIAPQHGFVEFSCPNKKRSKLEPILISKGFYPVDGDPAQLVASLVKGTLFGEQSMMGGWINDEHQYSYECKFGALACAKAEFALSRSQVNVVLKYISDLQKACHAHDLSKCTYHLLGRNCVDFVLDIAKVAEISDNVLAKLKIDENPKNDILERSLFSLADKAWKYVYLKTGGRVNIQDPRTASNYQPPPKADAVPPMIHIPKDTEI